MVPAGHQRRRGDRRRVPPLQPGARRRARADGGQAVPHRPPGRPERVHAARRHRRRRDGDARRGHQGHAGQRRRRGRGVLARHGQAARAAGAAAARARCPAGRAGEGEGRPRAPLDEPHALRAGPPAAAAQRAGGAGLAIRRCSRRRSTSEADYVFLDLEDAVAPGDKEQARTNVIAGAAGARLARPRQDDLGARSTASTPTTCTATWSTSWSRPATASTPS